MSWCSNDAFRCDRCGRFGHRADTRTVFGCANYDMPEPYDPDEICERCWPEFKEEWRAHFARGSRSGDWQKSRAEQEAAAESGLIWVDYLGDFDGSWADRTRVSYAYVTRDELARLIEHSPDWLRDKGERLLAVAS